MNLWLFVGARLVFSFLVVSLWSPLAEAYAEDLSSSATSGQIASEVTVRRASQECFSTLVHGSGYLVPRASAVVMFNMPDFRIADVKVKTGDTIKRGDIVARATSTAPAPQGNGSGDTSDVSIKSLASGRVLKSAIFEGMVTSQNAEPLFTLAVDGEIEASIDVPSVHIAELQAGQPAHLTTSDGGVIDGHIRQIPVTVDQQTQMGNTRIAIDSDQRLDPGRFLYARIEASRSCGIAVPRGALRGTSGGRQVQVVEDDRVVTRPVTIGKSDKTDFEITSGLAEGDLVVASTGTLLRDGDRVKPVLDDSQDAR